MDLKAFNGWMFPRSRNLAYLAAFALLLSALAASWGPGGIIRSRLSNYSGLLSFTFICLALLVTPLRASFPQFPLNTSLAFARRAFGVSGFALALVHYAFQQSFAQKLDVLALASFSASSGLGFAAGVAALALLFPLAATSTDFTMRKLGRRWTYVQKLSYLTYPLILAHALSVGPDLGGLNAFSAVFLAVAATTLSLEAVRLAKSLRIDLSAGQVVFAVLAFLAASLAVFAAMHPPVAASASLRQPAASLAANAGEPDSVITAAELSSHSSVSDCWVPFEGKVYDVSPFMLKHPGGPDLITPFCGKDSFEPEFVKQHGRRMVAMMLSQTRLVGDYAAQ